MEIKKEEAEEKEEIEDAKEESLEEDKEEELNSENNQEKKDIKQNIEKEEHFDSYDKQEQKNDEEIELESISTYILKYSRKGDELKEISDETGLRKSENCLFMLNIKLIKADSVLTEDDIPPENSENYLVFCCHEIAAIYFDEIYERVYTLSDLIKENKHFRAFESTEEAKNVIDEAIRKNEKNDKKIFLDFKNKELKLHMKLKFFVREEEIILNIPKKILTDEDKINLLPEFLKEIQDKMNHLNEENKKMKIKKTKAYNNRIREIKNNYRANNTFNFDISNNNGKDEIDIKSGSINKNDININENTLIKKNKKIVKKKQIKTEENFF